MSEFSTRKSLAGLEEYEVETTAASVVINANESNYSMPMPLRQKLAEAVADFAFNRYPPMEPAVLAGLVMADLPVKNIAVKAGNGSSELLQMACYAFGGAEHKIAFPTPSFSMYGIYAQMADSIAAPYPLDAEGYLDADALIEFCRREQPDLLIICNPNNPTGNFNPRVQVEKVLQAVSCPIIVDEAYFEFADAKESTLNLLDKYEHFMCLRTFSKAYGLAGMRVGYGVGNKKLMSILGKVLLPYHINAFSLLTAQTVYQNRALYQPYIAETIAERNALAERLTKLGFRVWPSATNFLCVAPQGDLQLKLAAKGQAAFAGQVGKTQAEQAGGYLFRSLLEAGIVVRDFTRHPLLQGCLRITVGLPAENTKLAAELQRLCEEGGHEKQ